MVRAKSRWIELTTVFILLLTVVLSSEGHNTVDKNQEMGKLWAVLIGVENYKDQRIADLRYTVDDAKTLYAALTAPQYGGFDKQNVKLLTDDALNENLKPTRRNILSIIKTWLMQTQPEDTVLFYYSGHGILGRDGKSYLTPIDAELNLLEDSAVSLDRVNEILDNRDLVRAKKVIVILDSCHSGARVGAKAAGDLGQILSPAFTKAEGRVTLASCSADEQSYEDPNKKHGVFTYYLTQALKGEADNNGNRDGYITISEVNKYVYLGVQDWARANGRKQTPRIQANVAGEILIGHNPKQLSLVLQKQREKEYKTYRNNIYKLGAEDKLGIDEVIKAANLLAKAIRMQTLSPVEEDWLALVKELADGNINVKWYRIALKGLGLEAQIETDISKPVITIFKPARMKSVGTTANLVIPVNSPTIRIVGIASGDEGIKEVKINEESADLEIVQAKDISTVPADSKVVRFEEMLTLSNGNNPVHIVAVDCSNKETKLQFVLKPNNSTLEYMVYIPKGWFIMGDDEGKEDETPQRKVWLDAYYIDKYEVTNAEYVEFLNSVKRNKSNEGYAYIDLSAEACQIQFSRGKYRVKPGYEQYPVVYVSWYGAHDYAVWAGKRLPTEAEWEKAARGPNGNKYPWGNAWDTTRANVHKPATGVPISVGSYKNGTSPYGVLDMTGNVWEWVADRYAADYYRNSPKRNPAGPDIGDKRVMRGGGCYANCKYARTAFRHDAKPDVKHRILGFRCAKEM